MRVSSLFIEFFDCLFRFPKYAFNQQQDNRKYSRTHQELLPPFEDVYLLFYDFFDFADFDSFVEAVFVGEIDGH